MAAPPAARAVLDQAMHRGVWALETKKDPAARREALSTATWGDHLIS